MENGIVKPQVIIDCDPGQDDAVALLLALASPDEMTVLGITTVAGNVPLELTQRNARIVCDLADRKEIPVFAGCDKPMRLERRTAEYVHGETGINGMNVFTPQTPLQKQHAVDYIIETLLAADKNSITLVPTGPLTNIATVFKREPKVAEHVKQIVLMGGAMREGGNVTPSAEFNIAIDPHAANLVFSFGRPITVLGLDVTHQVLTTAKRIAKIKELDNPVADAVAGMLSFFDRYDTQKYASQRAPLHDPCTIAYLLKPALFKSKFVNITVETESTLTLGHTAVDFWRVSSRPKNAHWVTQVDADGFYDLLTERLARF